jgi:hypothetical protein
MDLLPQCRASKIAQSTAMTELLPRPIYPPSEKRSPNPFQLDESKVPCQPQRCWGCTTQSAQKQVPLRPRLHLAGKFTTAQSALSKRRKPSAENDARSPQTSVGNSNAACLQTVTIPSSIDEALIIAAVEMQCWFECEYQIRYELSDLKHVLISWLETSIEQLMDDAFYHCCLGIAQYSFNRQGFQDALTVLNRRLGRTRDRNSPR